MKIKFAFLKQTRAIVMIRNTEEMRRMLCALSIASVLHKQVDQLRQYYRFVSMLQKMKERKGQRIKKSEPHHYHH